MIEILPGIYYDPSKEWFEQQQELIDLAREVMEEPPIASEDETGGGNNRMLWGEWQTTTSEGTFDMRLDMHYLYAIESRAYNAREKQDTVLVNQIF